MNYRSLAIAAVVAWIVDSIYGFAVFGVLLNGEFARYPAVFRSNEAVSAMMPLMLGALLAAMLVLAYIFAKGHEGGPGLQEGLRFGVVFGLWVTLAFGVGQYVIYNYGAGLAVWTSCAAFVEMVIVGAILGLVYKPAAQPSRRMAGV